MRDGNVFVYNLLHQELQKVNRFMDDIRKNMQHVQGKDSITWDELHKINDKYFKIKLSLESAMKYMKESKDEPYL